MRYVRNPDYSMFPRPLEGISGIDRSDDPLMSLEPEAIKVREAIRIVALHLHDATLVGNPAPRVERMREWMKKPRPGDLVTEESTSHRSADQLADPPGNWPYSRMGYLILTREEWADTDEEHEEHLVAEREIDPDYDERLTDTVTYIQYGPMPEAVCRWYDCSFLAIPTELYQFEVPTDIQSPDGSTVVTRDSLAADLIDSGFIRRDNPHIFEDVSEPGT